jgi:hypothetical protein
VDHRLGRSSGPLDLHRLTMSFFARLFGLTAIWVRCETCDNFWCTIHEMHVHDCPCPPVEEWWASPHLH